MNQVKLKLYNTLSRSIEVFKPIRSKYVGVYTCGPTVYNYAHIGNLRAYVFADILKRSLVHFGYEVKHVMNITDVGHLTSDADSGDDKMEKEALKLKLSAWDIANKYTNSFFEHTDKLNIIKPTVVCKATDHIKEQIEMITVLESKGFTYLTTDGVYFDSSKFEKYGDFAKINIDGLRGGERVDLAEKKNITDFALWKFSKEEEKRQMEWVSPWGVGFPGWHVECSAMAIKYLGEEFDIHTGGIDHISVHHTNEIAQSECYSGKSSFAKFWMHGEFLVLDQSEKMSKSSGNFLTLDSLSDESYDPEVYRYFLLCGHYRSSLKFSFDILDQSQAAYRRLKSLVIGLDIDLSVLELNEEALVYYQKFESFIANDLDMPSAVANLWNTLKCDTLSDSQKYLLLTKYDSVLGLGIASMAEEDIDIPKKVSDLMTKRELARADKDWKLADEIRDEILFSGFRIVDTSDGVKLEKV